MTVPSGQNDTNAQLRRALSALKDLRTRLEEVERARSEPIAIIGMGCRFPGAPNPRAFWELLRDGVDAIRETPADRWDAGALYDPNPDASGKVVTRWGGFLDNIDQFDAAFFGIAPREAAQMDPQQRLLLEVAWETLEDGGQVVERLAGSKTGVFVGIHSHSGDYYLMQAADARRLDVYSGTGTSHSVVSGRLSYLLDLRGPSVALDTACSSSLVAVHMAVQSLRNRECSLALAGGVNTILDPTFTIVASRMHMLSADGRCKPFDASADGIVRGEGCGLVLLKRLSDAVADGDRILAVIAGSAVNQDGRSNGLTAPNSLSQQAVIGEALANAGLKPGQIGLIEAHGTGTVLGDPIEVEALSAVFGAAQAGGYVCALGSAKASIGHLEGAAGVAGLIKAVLTLQHEAVPALTHFRALNPHITLANTPFVIPTELRPWPAGEQPRYVGVSSFGWSGTNAHIIVGEAPRPQVTTLAASETPYLLPISARSPEALRELAQAYQTLVASTKSATLRDICYSAGLRRSHHAERLAVVGRTGVELAEQLAAFLKGEPRQGLSAGRADSQRRDLVVFVFSGQGPQWWAMGRELLAGEPFFRKMVERCDALLRPHTGWSLLEELGRSEAESRLDQTEIAQPALFALQIGLAALWRAWGITPDGVVGHSVGEVAAAYVAGVLSLEDAVRVIAHRGRLMQQATGSGKMASVELPPEAVERVITAYGEQLSIAAINAPAMTVMSGDPIALEQAIAQLKSEGASVRPLPVNYAFHSTQMAPYGCELTRVLAGLQPQASTIPLYSTVTGALVSGTDLDASYWGRNVREPVRFAAAISALTAAGGTLFVEIGPHPVLGAAITHCLDAAGHQGVVTSSLRRGRPERETLLVALGELYMRGVAVEWSQILPGDGHYVALPTYPWQHQRYWLPQAPVRREQAVVDQVAGSLPGRRMPALAPLPGLSLWEAAIGAEAIPAILRSTVGAGAILSGAVYAWIGLQAAVEALGTEVLCLRDLAVRDDLLVMSREHYTIQTVITPGTSSAELHIYSRTNSSEAWIEHALAHIDTGPDALPAGMDLAALQVVCSLTDTHNLPLDEVRLGNSAALARLRHLDSLQDLAGPGYLATGLSLLTIFDETTSKANLVLERIDQIVGGISAEPVWAYVQLTERGDDRLSGNLFLLDEAGQVISAALGVRLRAPGNDLIARIAQTRIADWIYELEWQPSKSIAPVHPTIARTRWLLFADSNGVAVELASLLSKAGIETALVYPDSAPGCVVNGSLHIDATRADDVRRLVETARVEGSPWDRVVYLWGLDLSVDNSCTGEEILARQRMPTSAALQLVQVLAREPGPAPRIWLVTRGAVAAGRPATSITSAQATLWGFGRVVANEHPECWGGLIDLGYEPDDLAARSLFDALLADDGEDLVAIRQSARMVARIVRTHLAPGMPPRLRSDSTYLITGGLGGVGLVLARWMLRSGCHHLAILSRRSLDETSATILEELEHDGAQVIYLQADVSQSESLAAALSRLRANMPPLKGIVHAAGVIDDAALLGQSWERFERVMSAKVAGAWNLHRQTEGVELDLFMLCSSASALLGTPGQANYAAANAFLDALSHMRRAAGLAAISINWGRWGEVGMAADAGYSALLERRGMSAMPPEAGASAFGRLLGHPAAQVTVADISWPTFIDQLPRAGATPLYRELADTARGGREDLDIEQSNVLRMIEQATPASRYDLLLEHVRDCAATVLRFDTLERVAPDQGFFQIGMDSLTALAMKNRLGHSLGRSFPATLAFDYPTAAALAGHLLGELFPEAQDEPHRELEPESELAVLEQVTRDDLKALLDAELDAIDF